MDEDKFLLFSFEVDGKQVNGYFLPDDKDHIEVEVLEYLRNDGTIINEASVQIKETFITN